MTGKHNVIRFLWLAVAAVLSGCNPSPPRSSPQAQAGAQVASAEQKSGAQLWSENCSRCHNVRPPQSYSDAQWQVVVHHMRLRANLIGQETSRITEFLKSAN